MDQRPQDLVEKKVENSLKLTGTGNDLKQNTSSIDSKLIKNEISWNWEASALQRTLSSFGQSGIKMWKISIYYTSKEGLIPKIHKEFIKLDIKNKNN